MVSHYKIVQVLKSLSYSTRNRDTVSVVTIVVERAAAANGMFIGSDVNLSSSECWIMGCGRKRIRLRCFPFLDMFRSRHRMYG